MSILAHSTFGAPGFGAEKRALDGRIQAEILEAKRLQRQTGCTWTEALKLATSRTSANDADKAVVPPVFVRADRELERLRDAMQGGSHLGWPVLRGGK